MMFDFDPVQTLGIAIMVLYTGMLFIRHTSFLRNNDIPVPVVGGLLFAVITSLGDEKLGGKQADPSRESVPGSSWGETEQSPDN